MTTMAFYITCTSTRTPSLLHSTPLIPPTSSHPLRSSDRRPGHYGSFQIFYYHLLFLELSFGTLSRPLVLPFFLPIFLRHYLILKPVCFLGANCTKKGFCRALCCERCYINVHQVHYIHQTLHVYLHTHSSSSLISPQYGWICFGSTQTLNTVNRYPDKALLDTTSHNNYSEGTGIVSLLVILILNSLLCINQAYNP